jgi:hypothetical protein
MRPLLTILYRPRATMRRILASERRGVVPIILLAACSAALNESSKGTMPREIAELHIAVVVLVALIMTCILTVAILYALSWVAFGAGRLLEGKGNPRDVRAALAWGTAPVIWAILYRIPAALFLEEPTELRVTGSWVFYIALAIAEVTVFVWWLITTSNTLAVAHRFSVRRGFATFLLTLLMPFVLIAAALLTAAIKS